MLIGADLVTYTLTASSALTNHPAVNVQDFRYPYRTWQADVANADQWLRADLGSAKPLDGVFLDLPNVSMVTLQRSSDGSSFTDLGSFLVPVDKRVGRRKGYFRLSGFNHRYLRVVFPVAALLSPGAPMLETTFGELEFGGGFSMGTFELGTLALVGAIIDLNEFAPEPPLRYGRRDAFDLTEFASGGFETSNDGPSYLEMVLNLAGERALSGATQASLQDITVGQMIVVSEELGDPSKAYLVRRIQEDEEAEDFSMVTRGGWALREAV